jgi:hypothetical protein
MWAGYPFLLSAVVGDIEDELNLILKKYDVSNVLLSTEESTSDNFENSVATWDLNEIGTFTNVSYLKVYVETSVGEDLTDELTIDYLEACQNPIYILGRDSVGGHLQYLFHTNQEYNFDYGNNIKAARKVMTAVNLTANEWLAFQDWITLGDVYKNNIVELTSDTIKTSTRVGQQVYVVDTDGSKIGVVVIPTKNKTLTKQTRHVFELEIEYPENFVP